MNSGPYYNLKVGDSLNHLSLIWILLLVFIVFSRVIGLIPSAPISLFVIVLFLALVTSVFRPDPIQIYFPILVFFIYLLVNIVVTSPPEVFNSRVRLLFFCIVTSVVSPMIQSSAFRIFRQQLLLVLLYGCVLVAAISFFSYFLGINLMRGYDSELIDDYVASAGLFGGITIQSMVLGPISGIASIFMLVTLIRNRKFLSLLLLIICLGSLLFSASRSALLATATGLAIVLYKTVSDKGQFFKILFVVLVVAVISFPLWKSAISGLLLKQTIRSEIGGQYDSRTALFINRFREIRESPIIGVGFSSIRYGFVRISGTIEPGSSWLAILSMTGLIGFAFFIKLVTDSFRGIRNYIDNTKVSSLLFGLFFFFIVHMFFEGYVFAANSFFFFILWTVIGVSIDGLYYDNDSRINYCSY